MKVLLYTENEKILSKSGLGKAIKHQMNALKAVNIEYTTNPKDDFDIAHINFYGLKSYRLAKKLKKQGKKIVYHAHSTEEDFRNSFIFSNQVSKLFKKWLIKCYTLGDAINTPTEYSKKLLQSYGIKNDIYVISNGVELKNFGHNEKAGREFRKKYNFKKEDKIIVGIGLYIANDLFGISNENVRTHFRVLKDNMYIQYVVILGSEISKDKISDIPRGNSMIDKSFELKRSLVASLNPESKYDTNTVWEDFITLSEYNITKDGAPFLSMGVSIKYAEQFKDMLYFLSYYKIERCLVSYIDRINRVCDIIKTLE